MRYVAIVAHNDMKPSLFDFMAENASVFCDTPLVTTGGTGSALLTLGFQVEKCLASGPVGGDQQLAAMICRGMIAAAFFFIDPLSAHAHAADCDALIRVLDVHRIPYATNPATARGVIMALKILGLQWREEVGLQSVSLVDSAGFAADLSMVRCKTV